MEILWQNIIVKFYFFVFFFSVYNFQIFNEVSALCHTSIVPGIIRGGSKGRPARKSNNLTTICEPIVWTRMWEPRRLTTLWPFTACYRDSLSICV
jgi:hypothetical protein